MQSWKRIGDLPPIDLAAADILRSRDRIMGIIKDELLQVRTAFATPRRTQIVDWDADVDDEDLIARDPATIVLLTGADADPDQAVRDLAELLPTVAAVRAGNVVTMPESDSTNLRGVDGVEELSTALHP